MSFEIKGTVHAVIVAMIEHTLGLLSGMLWVEKHVLFAPTTLMIIKILKSFPLRLRNILVELLLAGLLPEILLLHSFLFLLFLQFWYVG